MSIQAKVCEKHRGGCRFCTACGYGKREHRPENRAQINAAVEARQNAARQGVAPAPRPRNPLYVIQGGRA